jgi:hypothetical protein
MELAGTINAALYLGVLSTTAALVVGPCNRLSCNTSGETTAVFVDIGLDGEPASSAADRFFASRNI